MRLLRLERDLKKKTREEEEKERKMPLANKEVVHLKNGWEKIQVKKKFIVNIVVVVVGERRAFSLSFSFLLLKELFFVFLIARSRWFENCSNEISLLLSLSLSLSL